MSATTSEPIEKDEVTHSQPQAQKQEQALAQEQISSNSSEDEFFDIDEYQVTLTETEAANTDQVLDKNLNSNDSSKLLELEDQHIINGAEPEPRLEKQVDINETSHSETKEKVEESFTQSSSNTTTTASAYRAFTRPALLKVKSANNTLRLNRSSSLPSFDDNGSTHFSRRSKLISGNSSASVDDINIKTSYANLGFNEEIKSKPIEVEAKVEVEESVKKKEKEAEVSDIAATFTEEKNRESHASYISKSHSPANFIEEHPILSKQLTFLNFSKSQANIAANDLNKTSVDNRNNTNVENPIDQRAVDSRKKATGQLGKVFLRAGSDADSASKYEVRVKTHNKRNVKDPLSSKLQRVQQISTHTGPIQTMKFSGDGKFLASGGQDKKIRIQVVVGSDENTKHVMQLEKEGRLSSTADLLQTVGVFSETDRNLAAGVGRRSPTPSKPQSIPHQDEASSSQYLSRFEVSRVKSHEASSESNYNFDIPYYVRNVLNPVPYRVFVGHKSDIISLAQSSANFLLSSSMDRTVRLQHISRDKCLCLFQHSDFVTSVVFHPIEDTYFLSGSFDKKLRLWNILEHRVTDWAQTPTLITSTAFTPDGTKCAAGLYNGQCIFYKTDGLKYFTQIDCRNRRGRFSSGRKVTGISFDQDSKRILITTNDSRIRMYSMDDFSMVEKFKGLENGQLQIQASFDDSCRSVICGSDDQHVYIQPIEYENDLMAQSSLNKNNTYQYFKVGSEIVTVALFSPYRFINYSQKASDISDEHRLMKCGLASEAPNRPIRNLIVCSDYSGLIKIFEDRSN